MNMVAADGAECGTSISWCYPFFLRRFDLRPKRRQAMARQTLPVAGAIFALDLAEPDGCEGFVIGNAAGKPAWMLPEISHPPTNRGELIEFLRIVELQAATSHAARILDHFAEVLGDASSRADWQKIQQVYAAKTQSLWKEDWFYDFDTRNGQLVTSVGRDVGQVAPVFCGIASDDQKEKMRPALQKFLSDSLEGRRLCQERRNWQDGLHWSSLCCLTSSLFGPRRKWTRLAGNSGDRRASLRQRRPPVGGEPIHRGQTTRLR